MKHKNLSFAHHDPEFKNYWRDENRKHHGGMYSVGKRKTRRPISVKKPIHLVMRSDIARGAMSLRTVKNWQRTNEILVRYAKRFNVRIYEHSINSNHIHISLRVKHRLDFQKFLKTVAGLIARHMLGAEKGSAKGKFWAMLAFTRVGEWGKAFYSLRGYVIQNILEAAGVIAYQPRKYTKLILTG